MTLTQPTPFSEALADRSLRKVLPTTLTSRQLQKIPAEVKQAATFSSRVDKIPFLDEIDRAATALADGKTDPATARLGLKQILQTLDYRPAEGKEGGLEDLSSDERLNLILDTTTRQAQGYGYFLQGQDPAVLDAYPAQELFRAVDTKHQRDWDERWDAARDATQEEGATSSSEGVLIALKDHPIWQALGDGAGGYDDTLGNPYPPFAFNSGMDVQDVDRDTAVQLGLLAPDDQVEPQERTMNESLQASAPRDFGDAVLKTLGDGYELVRGVLRVKNRDAREAFAAKAAASKKKGKA